MCSLLSQNYGYCFTFVRPNVFHELYIIVSFVDFVLKMLPQNNKTRPNQLRIIILNASPLLHLSIEVTHLEASEWRHLLLELEKSRAALWMDRN